MSKEVLLQQLTSNPNLPTPPSVALRVLEQASKPSCTLADIGRIISQDPSLSGRILKIVNSALYGLPRTVASVDRALSLLGLKRVRSLVLSLSLPTMQGRHRDNPRIRDYWKVSLASGIIASELSKRLKTADPETDMVGGLLSDLGMLVLHDVYPDQYMQVLAFPPEVLAQSQCQVEEKLIGVHHAELGAFLLQRWRLPEEIFIPIRHHHDPEQAPPEYRERAGLLHFANLVAQLQATVSSSVILSEIVSLAWSRFGMTDQEFRDFLTPLAQKVEEFAALLQLDIGTCQHYPALFASAMENLTRLAVETSLDNYRVCAEKSQAVEDLKKTEAVLQETEEKLRQSQKLEAIGRLAGGVAHDFNNLLTVINGYCEILLDELPTDLPWRRTIEQISKAGAKANNLTHQLLAFSRKQILTPRVLDLNKIVRSTQGMLKRVIGEDIELTTVLDPHLPNVKVDPGQIDQVILNLALNARDAMPNGGKFTMETKVVELDANYCTPLSDLQPGRFVLLAVSDDGCGMTRETREKVFEPFFTTKDGKGTGLGLATVHGIVKQSGGHITVYSEPKNGTVFRIYLPIAGASEVEDLTQPVQVVVPKGTETLLLTEDETEVRKIARQMLESHGYTVLEAGDGWDALRVSEGHKGPIHCLVTDTIMPQMGGCELAQRLAKIRPDMKVLYLSGYTDETIFRHGILGGRVPFLQKPFTSQTLASKVHEVLRG